MTAGLVGTRRAQAGDPSFMNNVPDPLLSETELPTFKFALEKSKGRVSGQNTAKEATVKQFPVSKGIAGVSMGLAPGGMRELHWHATAAEWAFVDRGRVRTTVLSPGGYRETNDFEPGDVWYFPRGHGHILECLGDEPCHFVLMFDNGYFSEFGTFSITDWIGHTPKEFPISKTITGAILELDPGALRELHWHPTADEWQYVYEGQVRVTLFGANGRHRVETLEKGDVGHVPQGYGHSLENVGDKPCRVLIGFNSGVYEDIDLTEWMAANPPDVLATNFGKPASLFEKFPHQDVFITDGDGHGK